MPAASSPGPLPLGQAQSSPSTDPAHLLGQSPGQQAKGGKAEEDGDSIFSVKGISSKQLLLSCRIMLCGSNFISSNGASAIAARRLLLLVTDTCYDTLAWMIMQSSDTRAKQICKGQSC